MPVNVKFGATTDDLEDGVKRAQDALANLGGSADDLQDAFSKASGASSDFASSLSLLGAGVSVGAIAGIVGAVESLNKGMLELQRDAHEAGLSLEQFQKYKLAANVEGVSDKDFGDAIKTAAEKYNELAYTTNSLSKLLDANNIKYKQANGELIPFAETWQKIIGLIANAGSGASKFNDQLKIGEMVGQSRQMVELWARGPGTLNAIGDAGKKNGLILSDELVTKGADFERQWNASVTAWSSFFKAKIVEITPLLTSLIEQIKGGIEGLTNLAADSEKVKGLPQDQQDEVQRQALVAMNILPPSDDGAAGVGTSTKATATAAAAAGPAVETFTSFIKNLGVEGFNAADAMKQLSTATDQVAGKKTVIPGDDKTRDGDAARVAMEQAQGVIQAQNLAYENTVQKLDSELSVHQITEAQKTAATLAAINAREDAELAAIAEAEKSDDLSAAQIERLENEKTAVILKAINDRTKEQENANKVAVQDWAATLQPIEAAFNSQLRSLLAGTETFGQAMKKIFADLVVAILQYFEKLAFEKLATSLAAAFGDPAAMFAGAAKSIQSSVGVVFAGEAANLALSLGPAAPAAAASIAAGVEATALSLSAFDVGTNYIARSGLAIVHQGESIQPAVGTGPWTGGNSGGNVSFNVSAIDSNSVQQFFVQNASRLSKIMQSNLQLNPSTQ